MSRKLSHLGRIRPLLGALGLASMAAVGWAAEPTAPFTTLPVAEDVEAEEEDEDLLDLDIGQLRQTSVASSFDEVVTTVSRQESTVGRSPAAVFVITQEMIRRSGARSIPEALRMAPGVHVARVDGNKWAIGIRGVNSRYSNKLLVQVDGRTVYRNTFAGVWWDEVDLLMQDIERIEVVRGPGGTVWGANAVNGVINILTKDSKDTRGSYVIAGGGTEERGLVGARVGGGNADNSMNWRAWGKWFDRDEQFSPTLPANDSAQASRGGLRLDWNPTCCDRMTLDAGIYDGTSGTTNDLPFLGVTLASPTFEGRHVLGRWTREYSETSASTLQFYYDHAERNELANRIRWDTYDIDFQHYFKPRHDHKVIWGLQYRNVDDAIATTTTPGLLIFSEETASIDLVSGFLQDEIELVDDSLFFTIGAKLSYYDFSGIDVQPSARLLAVLDERRVAWAAVSRAVRTPGRFQDDAQVVFGEFAGFPIVFSGNQETDSENVITYELGYRSQPADWFNWDIAGYYSVYEDIITEVPTSPLTFDFANEAGGSLYGVELTGELEMTDDWRLIGNYSFLSGFDENGISLASGSKNIVYLRSSWDLPGETEFDATMRYVDSPWEFSPPLDSYLTLDLRLSCRLSDHARASVVGQNLLDNSHSEWFSSAFGQLNTEVQRGVYGVLEMEY